MAAFGFGNMSRDKKLYLKVSGIKSTPEKKNNFNGSSRKT